MWIAARVSIYILSFAALYHSSVLPTYGGFPVKYNTTHRVRATNEYIFIKRNSSDNTQPMNGTYRLWGKTYSGLEWESPSSSNSSVDNSTRDVQHPQSEDNDVSDVDTGGQMITFEEISNTSYRVIRSRGVATALWDTVAIIYDCAMNFWGRGLVQCLTARTAFMLRSILGPAEPQSPGPRREGSRGSREMEQQPEGRKKMLKKMALPLLFAFKVKAFLVLIGVAMLAAKAFILSTASFLMSLLLYVRKHAGDSGHATEQITVYPGHYNKRLDEITTNFNGGRGMYM